MDQPSKAIECYNNALDKYPLEKSFILGKSRIYEALNDLKSASLFYKDVLN